MEVEPSPPARPTKLQKQDAVQHITARELVQQLMELAGQQGGDKQLAVEPPREA